MKVKQIVEPPQMDLETIREKLREAIHVCRGLEHARDITIDKVDHLLALAQEENSDSVIGYRNIGGNQFVVGKNKMTMKELQEGWFIFKGTDIAIKRIPKNADLISRLERYQESLDRGQDAYQKALTTFRTLSKQEEIASRSSRVHK